MRATNNKPAKNKRPQRSPAHRLRSVRLVLAGASTVKVGKKYGDSPGAVGQWVKRFKEHGAKGLESAARSGRPSSLTTSQQRRLEAYLEKERAESRKVSGGILATFIVRTFGVTLTRRQCERILKRLNP